MQCVWFGGVQYWKRAFRVGETLAASGQPTSFGGTLQFVHPDIDRITVQRGEPGPDAGGDEEGLEQEGEGVDWAARLNTGGLVPLYPSGQDLTRVGLDSAGFRRVIHGVLEARLGDVREILPGPLLADRKLMPLAEAVRSVHFPRSPGELQEGIRRLKYQELFLFELGLALKRRSVREEADGIAFNVKSTLARRLVDTLPFALTRAQVRVIREIAADMAAGRPMNRLLQGDVGSGKTIVALTAMLIAADNGYQSVFLAPTEILAEQHYKTLAALLEGMPVTLRLLVGAQRSRLRRDVLEDVRSGAAQIVVGTHALLGKDRRLRRLGVVVIDEQHRFGVLQRAALREKGGQSRRARDDRNPDPAHPVAHPVRRPRRLDHRRAPPGPEADPDDRERRRLQGVGLRLRPRNRSPKGARPISSTRWSRNPRPWTSRRRRSHLTYLQKEVFPDLRLGLMHGRMPSEEKDDVMIGLQTGRDPGAGRHHRDRGRDRRAQRHRDGDRERGAFRPLAASSAARPRRTRQRTSRTASFSPSSGSPSGPAGA